MTGPGAAALARYRKHRAAGVPASAAYTWVTGPDPLAAYPGLTWHTTVPWPSLPSATGEHHGYRITVTFALEQDPEPRGKFTDNPDGAIQNPAWRPGLSGYEQVYRWYRAESGTLEGHRADLRRVLGRHDAWLTARRYLLEELAADISPIRYVCTAQVSLAGIPLATESLYGIDTGGDPHDGYLREVAAEQITEALGAARDAARDLITAVSAEGADLP